MPQLKVRCCTWNVGDQGPPEQCLEEFAGLDEKICPDIIGIGLQEASSDGAWIDALTQLLSPRDYVLIKHRSCWAIWMLVFVKRPLRCWITNIESEVTPSGVGGVFGNKGGVSIRFEICGVNIIILSCHFAAHKEKKLDRINDYHDIIGAQTFRDDDVNVILDHDYIFWMGDLNFRLDNISHGDAVSFAQQGRIDKLLEHDQLNEAKRDKLIFEDFDEGKITFPPTFKFDVNTDTYDTSKKQRVPAWTDRILYLAHRDFAVDHYLNMVSSNKPSPKSRFIPFRGAPSQAAEDHPWDAKHQPKRMPKIDLLAYTSLPQYKYSDHRPVIGSFSIVTPSLWFDLPIKFNHSVGSSCITHSVVKDLVFDYSAYNPPNLLKFDEAKRTAVDVKRSKATPSVLKSSLLPVGIAGFLKQPKADASVTGGAPASPTSPAPLPPPALQTRDSDWIGVYPANFADLQSGYITYVYASAERASKQTGYPTLALMARDQDGRRSVPGKTEPGCVKRFTNRIPAKYLRHLTNQSIVLVYFDAKNCPRGYSGEIKLI